MEEPSLVLLRQALYNLSLEPEEQRRVLDGMVVTDELALDLDHAVRSLTRVRTARPDLRLGEEVIFEVETLNNKLAAPPGDDLWTDGALDRHPTWAHARTVARRLLASLPGDTG